VFCTSEQVLAELRQAVARHGGIRPFARANGVAASAVCDALKKGRVDPAVGNAVGFVLQSRWVRVEDDRVC
jgi:DNA-binding phage protein